MFHSTVTELISPPFMLSLMFELSAISYRVGLENAHTNQL